MPAAPAADSELSPLTPIAVVGAGAVGCYYGGMLARAGLPVTLIARPAHADAINAHGLRLQAQSFDEQVKVRADTRLEAAQDARLVLFCVKTRDTETTAAALAGILSPKAIVLDLQNPVQPGAVIHVTLNTANGKSISFDAVAKQFTGAKEPYHQSDGSGQSPASS